MPKKVLQEPGLTLWHLANVEFKEPRVVAHLMMRCVASGAVRGGERVLQVKR